MTETDLDWTCPVGYRHPKFARSLALQVWGLKCSRDFQCTRAEMERRAVDDGLTCVPDIRTLRQWAASEDWSGEVARMLRSIAPDIMGGMVVDLIMGASEGAPWLRKVLNGQEPKPNANRIRAILTALSMVGIPDLAHMETRAARADASAISQRTTVVDEASATAIDSGPVDGDWKARLAQRTGHTDRVSPPD